MTGSKIDPRDLAVRVLLRLESAPVTVQAALGALPERGGTSASAFALCTELCYGVLRTEIRLRVLLARFFTKQEKLPPHMICVLRTAAYALVFLDGMPEHAVVNWAVEAIKRRHGQTLARVANGGLRSLCREGAAVREFAYYRDMAGDERTAYTLYYSLPRWIFDVWELAYGSERALKLAEKSAARPRAGLRVNRSMQDWEQTAAHLEAAGAECLSETAFCASPAGLPEQINGRALGNLIAEGRLSRQGAGSQLAVETLDPDAWPEPVWDACAGRGTKSCSLLERGRQIFAASDTHLPRLSRVAEECRRLHLPVPPTICASLLHPPFARKPRAILVDAPCSGLGVLASRPDIRRNRRPEDVAELIRLQAAMLEAAYAFLPKGGGLAYITCTCNPAESEEQVRRLCVAHPGARLGQEWNSPVEDVRLEGMYAAWIVKT